MSLGRDGLRAGLLGAGAGARFGSGFLAGSHKPAAEDWLWNMLQRKPVKLVAIALAARMARTVWARIKTGESDAAKVA